MWDDPIVAETRTLREQVASHYHYDVLALSEYFKTKRAKDAKKLILQAVQSRERGQQQSRKKRTVAPQRQPVNA